VFVLVGVGLEYIAERPRTLDIAAQRRLTDALRKFPGTPFDLSVELDPESVSPTESIASALIAAGWNRQPIALGFGYATPGKPVAGIVAFAGLEIQIKDSRQPQWGQDGQAATILWHTLQREGLTTTAKHVPDNQGTPTAIHIKIETKP
jgi:hypothetical protein